MTEAAALSYHEPGIVTILILLSFLLLENAIGYVFDRLLFCGLIGQIAIGVAWGTPGANIMPLNVQDAIMQLGYLGLILLVYEGGLSTGLKTLKSNLFLSSIVALIGISAPIGLSFALRGFMGITPVQAFAAGAALCSTSLGTTFTILSTSGLNQSRLGVVLTSAAMIDDIVGLAMSGIISSLGQSSDFSAITVIRPVFVSLAFAFLVPLICVWIVRPLTKLAFKAAVERKGRVFSALATENATVILHTLVLIALVAGASYAGTSNLFAAYLAGAALTWWDDLCLDLRKEAYSTAPPETRGQQESAMDNLPAQTQSKANSSNDKTISEDSQDGDQSSKPQPDPKAEHRPASPSTPAPASSPGQKTLVSLRCSYIFHKYYSPALETILKPFFFASIGFSIPITRMFAGSVVWRGIVYTMLMLVGKLICGLCLVRFSSDIGSPIKILGRLSSITASRCWPRPIQTKEPKSRQQTQASRTPGSGDERPSTAQTSQQRRLSISKPISLYPAALLGSAMAARGEIGFLISSVAESNGVFGSPDGGQNSELFLVVTWAILLCTLLGPIAVGIMVRRVKRLQEIERSKKTGKEDPLGIWGIIPT